jgi:hypothetical protein
MPFKLYEFRSPMDAQHFLNGAVIGGVVPGEGLYNLVGLTMNFTTPVGAVTFTTGSGADPYKLQFNDIKSQMEAAIANLTVVRMYDGRIVFLRTGLSAAVVIPTTSQAAKPILGLPISGVVSGKLVVHDPTGSATPRLAFLTGGKDGAYILVGIFE